MLECRHSESFRASGGHFGCLNLCITVKTAFLLMIGGITYSAATITLCGCGTTSTVPILSTGDHTRQFY